MNFIITGGNPESNYSIVCVEKDGRAIFTSYTDTVIDACAYNEIIAVNASRLPSLIIKEADGKDYRVVNCMGEELCRGTVQGKLFEVCVPQSGIIFIK